LTRIKQKLNIVLIGFSFCENVKQYLGGDEEIPAEACSTFKCLHFLDLKGVRIEDKSLKLCKQKNTKLFLKKNTDFFFFNSNNTLCHLALYCYD